MICIKNRDFETESATVVTLGKFDGVHKGHQKLIEKAASIAKENNLKLAVFSFKVCEGYDYPYMDREHITTFSEREYILSKMGVDYFIEYPFDDETADTEPIKFVESVIAARMNAAYVVVGEDYTFGRRGEGDVNLLKGLQKLFNYTLEAVPKVSRNGRVIASSWIRDEIRNGNMENVNILLDYPFSIIGEVVHGKEIGRTIGFPTVNIECAKDKLLPPFGVYTTQIVIDDEVYCGVTNIGVKPSVTDENKITIETNIFDFDSDLYGKKIVVRLLHFQRPEMKFPELDNLKIQIEHDIAFARNYLQ